MRGLAEQFSEILRNPTPTSRQVTKGGRRKPGPGPTGRPMKRLSLAFALRRWDRRIRTLEPQTSTVSTYHGSQREGLRPYRTTSSHVLYMFYGQRSQVGIRGCILVCACRLPSTWPLYPATSPRPNHCENAVHRAFSREGSIDILK